MIIARTETGLSKGYGFVEFEDPQSVTAAVKEVSVQLEGRNVIFDVVKAGTPGFYPRRLGGGLGGRM